MRWSAAGHGPATTTATPETGLSATPLVSITPHPTTGLPLVRLDATRLAAIEPKGKRHRTLSAKYVVQSGDTLASIAQHRYRSSATGGRCKAKPPRSSTGTRSSRNTC